jgi:hypothetical protein
MGKMSESKRVERQQGWITACEEIHNNHYDYSKVHFSNNTTKVIIDCPDHGEFTQMPRDHKTGRGCMKCGIQRTKETKIDTTDSFVSKAEKVHEYKYDYTQVMYEKSMKAVIIICPEHGEFKQQPNNHIAGKGCLKCSGKNNPTTTEWITRANIIHNHRYTYQKTVYKNAHTPITITCTKHGDFEQVPDKHVGRKHGCPTCGGTKRSDTNGFVTDAQMVHGNRYGYDDVGYNLARDKVIIKCPIHDEFAQAAYKHLQGQGCPICVPKTSKAENEIYTYISDVLNISATQSNRSIVAPKELDIVIPSQKLAIEYCGIYWHSQIKGNKTRGYHRDKLRATNEAGYQLITIFDNEWENKQDIVKSRIKYILGKHEKGVGARSLQISEIDFATARDFMNDYHIQGSTTQMPIRYGAYHDDELVAVMAFSQPRVNMGRRDGHPELIRFCTNGKSYAGVGSRLLKTFIREHNPAGVISYSDRRWSEGDFYKALGFDHTGTSDPNYFYTKNHKVLENRSKYQKHKLVEKYGATEKSEWEIMQEHGYDRIWDCGSDRWEWTAE